ncbi:hypothetical protein C8R43DRAFT_39277 [Mycena crocata]|nr:hypothetical protein C8R43DRAFT_39277 [Mycena crocata]
MVLLAQELIDAIVHEIDGFDAADLRSCSLAARNFAPPSQRRLFRNMDFMDPAAGLLRKAALLLTTSLKISSYVHYFAFGGSRLSNFDTKFLTSILQTLHNLRRLSILQARLDEVPPALLSAIEATIARPSLQFLSILGGVVPAHIVLHAAASVRLMHLAVSVDRTGHQSNAELSLPAPSLTELYLTYLSVTLESIVLPILFPRPLELTFLSLMFLLGLSRPRILTELVAMSSETLQRLSLTQIVTPEFAAPPPLPHLPVLTHLELQFLRRARGDGNDDGNHTLNDVFATVPAHASMPCLRYLTIGLQPPPAISLASAALHSEFDAHLLAWTCLCDCHFYIQHGSREVDSDADSSLIEFIKTQLPQAQDKGLLTFSPTTSDPPAESD